MVVEAFLRIPSLTKTLTSESAKLGATGDRVPLLSLVAMSNFVVNWLIRFLRFELVSA